MIADLRQLENGWWLDPRYAYVGRARAGLDGRFGNPFKLSREEDRERVLALYRNWFLREVERDADFRAAVLALRGKILVCHCHPRRCHAEVILEWLAGQTDAWDWMDRAAAL